MSQHENVVAIVGAGRVGVTCGALLEGVLGAKVAFIDTDEEALSVAHDAVPTSTTHFAGTVDMLEGVLRTIKPKVVICSTPFHVNIKVATICAKLNCHYVDFTEDVQVTKAVQSLNPVQSTFVLQTGLAPGLVNSIGLELVERLKLEGAAPSSLKMRVGALPLVGTYPAVYSLTWSTSGLVNEYFQPVERIVDGLVVLDSPLDDEEELIADGVRLEAFNTSGGLGHASLYGGLSLVDYKTLRYPGHLEFLQKRLLPPLAELEGLDKLTEGMKLAEKLFTFTRQDQVFLVAIATGLKGARTIERAFTQRWKATDKFTALELTTSGTGCAVVELLLKDELRTGIVFGGAVSYQQLSGTRIGGSFLGEI